MDLYKLKDSKLKSVQTKQFKLERDIQNIVEENTEQLFNLQLVKSEFTIKNYRIDSLCFDQENKSFVIVEYKKGYLLKAKLLLSACCNYCLLETHLTSGKPQETFNVFITKYLLRKSLRNAAIPIAYQN